MIKIQLTKEEMDYAWELALKRYYAKPENVRNRTSLIDKDINLPEDARRNHDAFSHYVGEMAEIAITKKTGLPLDTRILPGGDDTDIGPIEVKGDRWPGEDITLKVKEEHYYTKFPELYVLCRVFDKVGLVYILAYIAREEFTRVMYPKTYRDGTDNFVVDIGDMILLTEENIDILTTYYNEWSSKEKE